MLTNVATLTWVETNGGPLLLLPKHLLARWDGEGGGDLPPTGDYARACSVTGYAGLLRVGDGQGLVLGDMPLPTTWVRVHTPNTMAGVLVRWLAADSEASVLSALEWMPAGIWALETLALQVGAEPLYLFDAAFPGEEAERSGALVFEVPAGDYHVRTASWQPDERTNLILHGFERQS